MASLCLGGIGASKASTVTCPNQLHSSRDPWIEFRILRTRQSQGWGISAAFKPKRHFLFVSAKKEHSENGTLKKLKDEAAKKPKVEEKGNGKSVAGGNGNGNGSLASLPHFEKPTFPIEPKAHFPDDARAHSAAKPPKNAKREYNYEKELERLHLELVKLQEWIKDKGLRVVVIFEGRDAAGKGGIIQTITEPLNPRICSVKALGTPSDREKTQWYFQRYVAHLPAAGEMVIFDRSWYNRAGVEKVMGFCNDEQYEEFLRSCPEFERMLVRSGIVLVKYWVSVSPEEQEKRFRERLSRPEKRWKLSPMDLYARARWSDYSRAKDVMFSYCDIKQAPWYVIPADDKKRARLNCISHLLSLIPYEDIIIPNDVELPPLQEDTYIRSPIADQTFIPLLF
eukprot:TRINITY_DN14474_c0_g1_i1.p1 TRINITY_DN14474_c0_g1~~TRINITY_DN14474_c0_g1_i1.p1  ORF type:complete len:412 (-),score=68.02 TRINITY_DN14474_c0_g1_i1:223-1410(-)